MSLIGATGGVIGAAGVAAGGGGPASGTLLLGPSDPANFTVPDAYTLNPDHVYYYLNGYTGAESGDAAKVRVLLSEDPTTGSPYITAALWNASGTLLAHTEIDTSDGNNWYSGAFASPPSIVESTTYYLGVFIGTYVPFYGRSGDPSYRMKVVSSSYGDDGSNPTPPNISPSTDDDFGSAELCIQLLA
ncbi:MAG: DUF4082 domain-containing protein [Gammaproteobacteria bacterium]|jgi:hypothetical protein|nr:DUF4082 domain-containing protein [Gammaproteobacteria bacterium]